MQPLQQRPHRVLCGTWEPLGLTIQDDVAGVCSGRTWMRRMSRCCYTKAAACWRISAPKFRNLVAEWSDARLLSHLTCTLDAARYPSRIVPRLCTSTAGSCSGHDVQSCGDIALHSHSIFIHSFTCRTGQTCGESAATTIRRRRRR